MKHKNKDGISLNYTSDDIHTRLVKEVIGEAIITLENTKYSTRGGRYGSRWGGVNDTINFLKENYDLKTVEDYINE